MLLRADFNTHMYPELIGVIERQDDTILPEAIEAAEGEAKGYLSRYDADTLFDLNGDDRDATLLMRLKDIAIWHFIVLANPSTDMELRKTRYDEAIKWLLQIQSGKIVQKNWPVPQPEIQGADYFLVSSSPKRNTRY